MQAMKKAGERDGEAEREAAVRRGRPLSVQYSAHISQCSLLPEETLEGNIPWIFPGLASARLKFQDHRDQRSTEFSSFKSNPGSPV